MVKYISCEAQDELPTVIDTVEPLSGMVKSDVVVYGVVLTTGRVTANEFRNNLDKDDISDVLGTVQPIWVGREPLFETVKVYGVTTVTTFHESNEYGCGLLPIWITHITR